MRTATTWRLPAVHLATECCLTLPPLTPPPSLHTSGMDPYRPNLEAAGRTLREFAVTRRLHALAHAQVCTTALLPPHTVSVPSFSVPPHSPPTSPLSELLLPLQAAAAATPTAAAALAGHCRRYPNRCRCHCPQDPEHEFLPPYPIPCRPPLVLPLPLLP